MKFKIRINEILSKTVEIEAQTENEEKHFQECDEEEEVKQNHIYLYLKELKDLISYEPIIEKK